MVASGNDDHCFYFKQRGIGDGIGNNRNRFMLKPFPPVTIEGHLQHSRFARFYGFFGVFRNGTTATATHIRNDQIGIARIFEFKGIGNFFALYEFPEIMFLMRKLDLGYFCRNLIRCGNRIVDNIGRKPVALRGVPAPPHQQHDHCYR